jgi:hypothetical protein
MVLRNLGAKADRLPTRIASYPENSDGIEENEDEPAQVRHLRMTVGNADECFHIEHPDAHDCRVDDYGDDRNLRL